MGLNESRVFKQENMVSYGSAFMLCATGCHEFDYFVIAQIRIVRFC